MVAGQSLRARGEEEESCGELGAELSWASPLSKQRTRRTKHWPWRGVKCVQVCEKVDR